MKHFRQTSVLTRNTLFLIAIIAGFMLVSCSSSNKSQQKTAVDMHTSEISLDWQGTYYGVTPCASCPGIKTELTLTNEMDYVLTQIYIDEGENKFITKGTFTWKGGTIKLGGVDKDTSPRAFKVEENRVRQLDLQGNVIAGDLTSNYILTKNGNVNVEDKKWQLTELNGQPVTGSAETHYLIFHSNMQRIEAKANCNTLNIPYTIRNQFQLITGEGINTMMACPDSEALEHRLIGAIRQADNLSVTQTSLVLNKARMAPLAKFELAHLPGTSAKN